MIDSNPKALTKYLCEQLNKLNLAYLHIIQGDFFDKQTNDILSVCEETYQENVIWNMGCNPGKAIKNNNLKVAAKLNDATKKKIYTPGPADYNFLINLKI
jgi:hypothetical protein